MEIISILIALLAFFFVLFHAWVRRVPFWKAFLWAVSVFLFLIIMLPVYFIVSPKGPEEDQKAP